MEAQAPILDTWETFQRNRGYRPDVVRRVNAERRARASQSSSAPPKGPALPGMELERALNLLRDRGCPKADREIVEAVCRKHGVSMLPVIRGKRRYDIVKARDEAIYELRLRQDPKRQSLPLIGRYFGLDHTSIMAALARYSLRSGKPALTQSSYYRRRVLKDMSPIGKAAALPTPPSTEQG